MTYKSVVWIPQYVIVCNSIYLTYYSYINPTITHYYTLDAVPMYARIMPVIVSIKPFNSYVSVC